MIIYHTFTKDEITYHIIDDFYPDDVLRFGDVYIRLNSISKHNKTEYFCNILENCDNCAVREVCSNDNSDRFNAILKLAPDLLTNFPELSI